MKIEPVIGASLTLVADNGERNVRCLISGSINRKNSVIRIDPRGFNVHKKPAPQNIAIIDRPARVELNSIGKDAAVDPSRQAGENQISFIVRCEQSRAVAAKQCQLEVDIFERFLIRENCKVILFVLILAHEPGIRILRERSGEREHRRLGWIGRNLEIRVSAIQQQPDSTGIINDIGEARESFVLLGEVVDGVVPAGPIFDPEIVLVVAADCIIIEAALHTSNLETWKYGLVRTTIVRQVTTSQCGGVFGVNVDNTS